MAISLKTGVNKLTNDFRNDVQSIIDRCADRDLTEEDLRQCEWKIGESMQTYVAQCLQLTSAIDLNFGKNARESNVNFGSRIPENQAEVAKKYIGRLVDMLPGQKAKREKEQLRQALETTVNQWIANCDQNPNLQAARGMEDYGLQCNDFRAQNVNKQMIVDEMISRVDN